MTDPLASVRAHDDRIGAHVVSGLQNPTRNLVDDGAHNDLRSVAPQASCDLFEASLGRALRVLSERHGLAVAGRRDARVGGQPLGQLRDVDENDARAMAAGQVHQQRLHASRAD